MDQYSSSLKVRLNYVLNSLMEHVLGSSMEWDEEQLSLHHLRKKKLQKSMTLSDQKGKRCLSYLDSE